MKIKSLVVIALFCLLFAPQAYAEKVDYIGFVSLEFNLLHLLILGDVVDMGSGVVVDFNTGDILWHVGARVHYLAGFGIAGEAGLGFVFYSVYDTSAPFTQVIPINSWTVGDIRYTEYQVTKGHCPAVWLHVIEGGVRPHYMTSSGYDWESVFSDVIFYAGYRLVSTYAEVMTNEEVELTLHALVGLTSRYYDGSTVIRDNGRAAFGIAAGFKWNVFHVNIAYYDEFFYMDYAIRFKINIM